MYIQNHFRINDPSTFISFFKLFVTKAFLIVKIIEILGWIYIDDFYDKEGFRDEEFEKGDKGTWIIYSEMVIEPKGKNQWVYHRYHL
jgi:hypothetical protein